MSDAGIIRDYIEIAPNVELYYESAGSGDPVIFIPGWTFTTEVFAAQMAHFSKTHQAISYDPRSHGRSVKTLDGNNYATHGADLIQLIKKLGLSNVTLAGWSFGCLTAWEYIRQAGTENIKAVAAVDLSPKPLSVSAQDWTEGPLDEVAGVYNTFLGSARGQREFIEYYAKNVMVQRALTEEELFWLSEQSLKTPHYIAAALLASGMFSDYREEAKKADDALPCLYVVAEHWAETAAAFVRRHFPNSRAEALGGHLMFWEHPEKFNRLLDEFLGAR